MFDKYNFLKYIIEGFAISFVVALIVGKYDANVVLIGVTAAAINALLDTFSPVVAEGVRRGNGIGIGWNLIK